MRNKFDLTIQMIKGFVVVFLISELHSLMIHSSLRFSVLLTLILQLSEAAVRRCSLKYVFLKICNIHRKASVLKSLFNKVVYLTPTQMFSCEIWEIFKSPFFTEHLRWLLQSLTPDSIRMLPIDVLLSAKLLKVVCTNDNVA